MNIKIFMQTGNSDLEHHILMNVGTGLKLWLDKNFSNNDTTQIRIGKWEDRDVPHLEYEYGEFYSPCNLSVMMGSWKPRDKGHHAVRTSVATHSNLFFCIETALLGRKTDQENSHYRVGINGFLNQAAYWPDPDPEQGQQRLNELGLSKWGGWKSNKKGHILIALQLPSDASLRGADINEWALGVIKYLRQQTNRPIVIRSHPLISDRGFVSHAPLAIELLTQQIPNIRYSHGAERSWDQDIKDAYCTVTYTSGLAIDSIVAGIPTIACDAGNFAYSLSSNSLSDINTLKLASEEDVISWLQQLAINQWTVSEMSTPDMWDRYMNVVMRLQDKISRFEPDKKEKK